MKHAPSSLLCSIVLSGLLSLNCFEAPPTGGFDAKNTLAGCTPGDGPIKSVLGIPADVKVDFIRWALALNEAGSEQNTFALKLVFGESQPNTLGFKGGGRRLSFSGTFVKEQNGQGNIRREVYRLRGGKLPGEIVLVKLNSNLFHLLTPENRLMVGNGGWSYTLNRKEITKEDAGLPALTNAGLIMGDTTQQLVFDGRTPCQNFASEHNMAVSSSCFKLKWRLTLNRDPVSREPDTYAIRKIVDNEPCDVSGRWTILKGVPENPEAVIYQLDPDKPEESICLLAGDENVLFFLNKSKQLFVGNDNFSFTLNKHE